MKKFVRFVAVAAVLFAGASLFSCTSSSETISEGEILDQINDLISEQAADVVYVPFTVGAYECNDADSRLVMRQLNEAGIIEYKVTRYAWWEKYDRYWRPYNFEDHYIVNLALTSKGKRIAITELPEPIEQVDEDMLQPEIDPAEYSWNKANLVEEWPEIYNPFVEREPAESYEENEDLGAFSDEDDDYYDAFEEDDEEYDDGTERNDKQQYVQYKAFEASPEQIYFEACEIEAIKARNIVIYENQGARRARAEVIFSTVDATDAGRILYGVEEDLRQLVEVEFIYFEDKGWVLNPDFDFEDEFDF